MHGGSGGVDPAKLFRSGDLIAAQGPRDGEISVGNLFGNAVIIRNLHDIDLGKIVAQPLRKPLRRDPGLESVREGDQELHENSFEFPVSGWESTVVARQFATHAPKCKAPPPAGGRSGLLFESPRRAGLNSSLPLLPRADRAQSSLWVAGHRGCPT